MLIRRVAFIILACLSLAACASPTVSEVATGAFWGDRGEEAQANSLGAVLKAADQEDIAGWLVWTAFDFSPPAGQPANVEHFFGLWRADLTAKPALSVLPSVTLP